MGARARGWPPAKRMARVSPTWSRPFASAMQPLPYNSFMTRQTVSRVVPIRSAIS